MKSLINYHVIDPKNIGDLLSSPAHYFNFPNHPVETADIRDISIDNARGKHFIVGGGGLLFPRFQESLNKLSAIKSGKQLIAWGIGQQNYKLKTANFSTDFDYAQYLNQFDLVGIRDFGSPYYWVPCASCLHPAFDKPREIKHEFVVFSHKKFQIKIDNFPRITNDSKSFEEVLDFLGSGETILTSSYHGAYWGTLLGRKVLAFPFSSKFFTLKHKPALYPIKSWKQPKHPFFRVMQRIGIAHFFYDSPYQNKFTSPLDNWQTQLQNCQAYPESLEDCRNQNRWYYEQVLCRLN